VSIDVTSDDEGARKFLEEKKITFTSLRGSWEAAREKYGVDGTPANFLIDQQGRVLFEHFGFRGEEGIKQMGSEIEAMLSRPAKS
jgi:peroxiredoxin